MTSTLADYAATVPTPGAYLVAAPSRGALVHLATVGDYVTPEATPEYRVRGTSCAARVRPTWTVTPVPSHAAAIDAVTCPTCRGWAQHHAEEDQAAALPADLSPTMRDAAARGLVAHAREAARTVATEPVRRDQVTARVDLTPRGADGTPYRGTATPAEAAATPGMPAWLLAAPTDVEAGLPERIAAQTDAEAAAEGWIDPDADAIAAEHRYTVPLGAGSPPFCSCGVVGGHGGNRPLLATHLRDVGHPDFD